MASSEARTLGTRGWSRPTLAGKPRLAVIFESVSVRLPPRSSPWMPASTVLMATSSPRVRMASTFCTVLTRLVSAWV
ncbi:hypothetical protein D9M69_686110 [compost metagenome]